MAGGVPGLRTTVQGPQEPHARKSKEGRGQGERPRSNERTSPGTGETDLGSSRAGGGAIWSRDLVERSEGVM